MMRGWGLMVAVLLALGAQAEAAKLTVTASRTEALYTQGDTADCSELAVLGNESLPLHIVRLSVESPSSDVSYRWSAPTPSVGFFVADLPLGPSDQTRLVRTFTTELGNAVREAVTRGVRDVVLIGAGFDTRALRMPELRSGVRVVEIDHAGQIAEKKRRFAAAAAVSRPMTRFMCHCWKICSELLISQYSTRPAGKKMNITENAIGMICITFACTGSWIGVGDSFTCR